MIEQGTLRKCCTFDLWPVCRSVLKLRRCLVGVLWRLQSRRFCAVMNEFGHQPYFTRPWKLP